jgi:hypothetical protein
VDTAGNNPQQVPTFTVQVHPAGDKPSQAVFPLVQDTYIQSMLDQLGIAKRFRRVKVELYRPLAEGHLRMDIQYDREERRVPPGYDYALRPNDQLVITEDPSTVVDDILESVQIPFLAAQRD